MAESITAFTLAATLKGTLKNTLAGSAKDPTVDQGFAIRLATALATGTGANQADRIWADDTPRVLAAGANEDIDVFDLGAINIGGGAGRSALGQALALTEIVGFLVHVVSDSPGGTLLVGGNGTAAAWNSPFNGSDTAQFGPLGTDGWLFALRPDDPAWAVADASNHLLRITEAGGVSPVWYEIALLGRSA